MADEEKKRLYDELLTNPPKVRVANGKEGKDTVLFALVPFAKIIQEFKDYLKDLFQQKDENGKPLFNKNDFTYEEKNGVLILTFPDKKSGDEFIQKLFGKNMVMFPNGSQNIESPIPLKQEMQNLRDSMSPNDSFADDNKNSALSPLRTTPNPY